MCLSMKRMSINNIQNFPFPTPPEEGSEFYFALTRHQFTHTGAIRESLRSLLSLGALSKNKKTLPITPLGVAMEKFPVAPHLAKMLLLGQSDNCANYTIAVRIHGLSFSYSTTTSDFLRLWPLWQWGTRSSTRMALLLIKKRLKTRRKKGCKNTEKCRYTIVVDPSILYWFCSDFTKCIETEIATHSHGWMQFVRGSTLGVLLSSPRSRACTWR